jgi:hypothetical protein
MTDHNSPLSHPRVLTALQILRRIHPAATVTGDREAVRIDGLVFTVALAPTTHRDEYDGLYLAVINPAVGELDRVKIAFRDYGVRTGSVRKLPLERIGRHNVARLLDGVSASALEDAVRAHMRHFTGTAV